MKKFKKAWALLLAMAMIFLSACESGVTGTLAEGESADVSGVYTSEIGTLNFLITNKSVDADAIARFCDPLVLVNKYGGFEPGMATSWEQSKDGKTWTFNIREGIKWQKWDGSVYGPDITAQDWVDAIEYILDPDLASYTLDFVLHYIEGAQDYYDGKTTFDKVGVKAVDTYTLEYTTIDVVPFFASLVTYSCYLPINKQFVDEIGGIENFGNSKENFLYYGESLFESWIQDQEWVFVKNPDYYLAERMHINRATYVMVQDAKVALEMYKRGEVTSASIVSDQVDAMFADPELSPYVYQTDLTASSWYYYFNLADNNPNRNLVTAANNYNFRKAIFNAFDRTTILSVSNKYAPEELKRNTLNVWGLSVDENGKDYMSYDKLPEIEATDNFDKAAAVEHMDKAKEELGDTVTWPVNIVVFSTNSETNTLIAEIIKQLFEETFGKDTITVDFAMYPSAQYYAKQEEGMYDFTSTGWIPDFADPSAYLEINMVDGYIGGRSGFASNDDWVTFDGMMRKAKAITGSLSERYAALAAAEVYLIEQALVIPHRGTGGNYAINNLQNPYDSLARIPYGLCNSMWKDLVYGTTPLSAADRTAQREEYYKNRP